MTIKTKSEPGRPYRIKGPANKILAALACSGPLLLEAQKAADGPRPEDGVDALRLLCDKLNRILE